MIVGAYKMPLRYDPSPVEIQFSEQRVVELPSLKGAMKLVGND